MPALPAGSTHRCPTCGKMVEVASLGYSESARAFVCPECRTPSPSRSQPAGQPGSSLPWVLATAALALICLALLILVLVHRGGGSSAEANTGRAWEDAHRDEIVALKGDA